MKIIVESGMEKILILTEARLIRKLCDKYRVPLIINDNPEIALQSGADGIHVGQEDMPVKEIRKKAGSDFTIRTKTDMQAAAKLIFDNCGCAVLCKGGHSINDANDLLYADGEYTWFAGKRINNPNTHGTGCTLSSAIAANLAKGYELRHGG